MTNIRQKLYSLSVGKDKFVVDVANRFSSLYSIRDEKGLRELINYLGKFGSNYTTISLKGGKYNLVLNLLITNFYELIERLSYDHEYFIRYGVGEYALIYNTPVHLLSTKPHKTNLFRISNKSYNNKIGAENSYEFASNYAKRCVRHISGLGDNHSGKTNSYSKSLGVILYKYLVKCDETHDGKEYFKFKLIPDTDINVLTTDSGETFNLAHINNYKDVDVTNMILDASTYYPGRSHSEWGATAGNKWISQTISPSRDREVLVYDDSICKEYNLELREVLALIVKYDCIGRHLELSSLKFVINKLLTCEQFSQSLIEKSNIAKTLYTLLNENFDIANVDTILSQALCYGKLNKYEPKEYYKYDFWIESKVHPVVNLLRNIMDTICDDSTVNRDIHSVLDKLSIRGCY